MDDLVEIVKGKLTEEYQRQRKMLEEQRDLKNALAKLDQTYQNLAAQVDTLAKFKVPRDLIDLYVRTGGRVWVSRKVYVEGRYEGELDITRQGNSLSRSAPAADPIRVPGGLYRLVLVAIPEEISEKDRNAGHLVDDYGWGFTIGSDVR
jgi:hypothetical protein